MVAGTCIGLFLATLFALTTFRYELTEKSLNVFFLGIKMRNLEYKQITDCKKGWKIVMGQQFLCGKISMYTKRDKAITITVKKGLDLVITPDNPDDFIKNLKLKIQIDN